MQTIKRFVLLAICAATSLPVFAGEAITYYHSDMIGSPVAATDAAGYLRWRAAYRPYGDRDQTFNEQLASADNEKWFTGHVHDEETGLTYAGARYYDPTLGRFLSVDPIGFKAENEQSFGRYTYVNDNPYKYVDPTGEELVFAPGSSPAFRAGFAQILEYHKAHGTAGVFARLAGRPEVITLREGSSIDDFSYNPNTRTITFHPTSAWEIDEFDPATGRYVFTGKVQTPALGLLHEAGHADYHLYHEAQYLRDRVTPDADYTRVVERRAIEDYETPAARAIGEPTRTNYEGYPRLVSCPTCTK